MSIRKKHPGSVLQHTTGANIEERVQMNSSTETYANLGEFQSRHVMQRCGIGRRKASVIADLFFGEGRQ